MSNKNFQIKNGLSVNGEEVIRADGTYVGDIFIANTTVVPGVYTEPTLTIDPKGRITLASNNYTSQAAFNQANTANTRAFNTVLKSGDTMTGALNISSALVGTTWGTGALNINGNIVSNNAVYFGGSGSFGTANGANKFANSLLSAIGNSTSYAQAVLQNGNSGIGSSTDFVATADNGTDTDTFINMGINSSSYNQAGYELTGPNDGYVYVYGNTATGGGNLVLSTFTPKDIVFSLNGQGVGNEYARFQYNTGLKLKNLPLTFADNTSQNTAYNPGIDVTQNTQIAVIQGVDLGQNSAISIIQGVNLGQNTTITAVNQYAASAYSTANGANGLAAGAYNQANVTIGVDATQNTRLNSIETINTNQNTTISIIQGVDATQNTRLNSIETINTNQNTTISIIQGVNLGQNATITAVNQYAASAYSTANGANGLAAGAYNQANVTIGVDTTQNTRLNSIETINTNQNTTISIIQGVDTTQNTRLNSIETINTNQNTTISIIQGVDLGQNTTITAVNQFAQSAFNKANTGTSGLLANSVLFANSAGFLSNTSNLQFFTSNNTVITSNYIANGNITIANTATKNSATMIYNSTLNSIDFYFN